MEICQYGNLLGRLNVDWPHDTQLLDTHAVPVRAEPLQLVARVLWVWVCLGGVGREGSLQCGSEDRQGVGSVCMSTWVCIAPYQLNPLQAKAMKVVQAKAMKVVKGVQ